MAARRGTDLHELAARSINLGVKFQGRNTIAMYVNDAIGFRMTTEKTLYYSDNCFGTADTIGYRRKTLRIHDLKTGDSPTSENQLKVYAALFFLEYKVDVFETTMEFRIYQTDECRTYVGIPEEIRTIMGTIIMFDKRIEALKMEV